MGMHVHHSRRGFASHLLAAVLAALALVAAACGDSDDGGAGSVTETTGESATTAAGDGPATTPAVEPEPTTSLQDATAGGTLAELDPERCQANRDVGTITYPTAFSFAAAVSILDPIVADAEGFYEDMCLDVDIVPSNAGQASAAMAAGQAQISEIGSFGEMAVLNSRTGTDFVAVADYGKTAVQALVVPTEAGIGDLTDLRGRTVGIKTDLPSPVQVMLAKAGVERGEFEELLLEGFDPIAHLELGIDALPVYKSNEPMTIDAAGIDYTLYDPLDYDVPASFGIIYTSADFLAEHRATVEDFVRATFRGFQFARENPSAAVAHAVELINTPESNFSSTQEAEEFRWVTESDIVVDTTPQDQGVGLVDPALFTEEVQSLVDVGLMDEMPDLEPMMDAAVAEALYDGDSLIWPGG
jgi:ABC-type nitrate/sulfonate/bicarbonate transport system substrate-binding protein